MKTLQWRGLWALYCPAMSRDGLDECLWLQESPAQWPSEVNSPVEFCDRLARLYSAHMPEAHRKARGQFFTPPPIARFMAELSHGLDTGAWVVEPGLAQGF
jgi:hypothetical protein